jgi:hypothetical protein
VGQKGLYVTIEQARSAVCSVSVMGVAIQVTSSLGWLPDQSMFGMWETQLDQCLASTATVTHTTDRSGWRLDRTGEPEIEIGSLNVTRRANPYFSIGLFTAEIRRQLSGVFHLHAAGLAFESGAVLLAGPSGVGKTIMALRLGSGETVRYGGADRCQIGLRAGRLSLLGHWRNTRLRSFSAGPMARDDAVRRRLSQDVLGWLGTAHTGWDVKKTWAVEDLGLTPLTDSVPIAAIYDLRVLAPGTPLLVEPVAPRDAVYAMSAALSDLTSGHLILLDDDGLPMMPAFHDTISGAVEQRQELVAAARHIPRYRLRGDEAEVYAYLQEQHNPEASKSW